MLQMISLILKTKLSAKFKMDCVEDFENDFLSLFNYSFI